MRSQASNVGSDTEAYGEESDVDSVDGLVIRANNAPITDCRGDTKVPGCAPASEVENVVTMPALVLKPDAKPTLHKRKKGDLAKKQQTQRRSPQCFHRSKKRSHHDGYESDMDGDGPDAAFWQSVREEVDDSDRFAYYFPIGDLCVKLGADKSLSSSTREKIHALKCWKGRTQLGVEKMIELTGKHKIAHCLAVFKETAEAKGYNVTMGSPQSVWTTIRNGAFLDRPGDGRRRSSTTRVHAPTLEPEPAPDPVPAPTPTPGPSPPVGDAGVAEPTVAVSANSEAAPFVEIANTTRSDHNGVPFVEIAENIWSKNWESWMKHVRNNCPWTVPAIALVEPPRDHTEESVLAKAREKGVIVFRGGTATGYRDVYMDRSQEGVRFFGKHDLEKKDPATTALSAAIAYSTSDMYENDVRFMQMTSCTGLTTKEVVQASHEAARIDPKVISERDEARMRVYQQESCIREARVHADLGRQGVKRCRVALEGYERSMERAIATIAEEQQCKLREAQKVHDAANAKVGRLAAEATEAAWARANDAK